MPCGVLRSVVAVPADPGPRIAGRAAHLHVDARHVSERLSHRVRIQRDDVVDRHDALHPPVRVDDRPRLRRPPCARPEGAPDVAVGDEADLLRLGLAGVGKAGPLRQGARVEEIVVYRGKEYRSLIEVPASPS